MALGKKSILDGLGLALSGSVAESGVNRRSNTCTDQGLGGEHHRHRHGTEGVQERFAAFANGVGVHADDYDDTQLAAAEETGSTGC